MDKEELLKLANDVAAKAESDAKTQDIERVIARIKADILTKVGDQVGALVMAEAMELVALKKSDPFAAIPPRPTYGGNVSHDIAECAEIIMRRAWIEKR